MGGVLDLNQRTRHAPPLGHPSRLKLPPGHSGAGGAQRRVTRTPPRDSQAAPLTGCEVSTASGMQQPRHPFYPPFPWWDQQAARSTLLHFPLYRCLQGYGSALGCEGPSQAISMCWYRPRQALTECRFGPSARGRLFTAGRYASWPWWSASRPLASRDPSAGDFNTKWHIRGFNRLRMLANGGAHTGTR